ncbi:SURF1 family protein [Variovorax sp. JS1663]|uniref:SURF1 family protein n=1 Tax=Variovorax sp. JS1663 TaxID=1851577 RepID=UPI0023546376|nr:SURF1 family protein [Variovorax sp. JS1663]
MSGTPSDTSRRPHSTPALALLALAGVLLFALFAALGMWQLERRAWKLDLIERVETRVHAAPADIPPLAQWPQVNAAGDEYRHVRLSGSFLHERETLVQASTVLGPGHWVLTPLRTAQGTIVLVNRGFVPPERRERASRSGNEPAGEVQLTGLLRISEPGGGFLRRNDPAGDRWFSRDVQAIAAARGLPGAAPFFVDEDAPPGQPAPGAEPRWPAAGLTVIVFRNNHLVYALTWFALALGVAAAAWWVVRSARQSRDASEH